MRRPHARSSHVNNSNSNSNKNPMDPIHKHTRPTKPKPQPTTRPISLLTLSLTLVSLSSLYLYSRRHFLSHSHRYGLVIDAGSTGTRIHVIRAGPGSEFSVDGSMRVNPGLSAHAGDPDRAGESLVELLELGRRKVPKEMWGESEVRLMATAGLRLLDEGVQDRVIEACRRVLRGSGFRFRDEWASVISGSDEGLYAWVVANYALGSLGGDPSETTGIIELGGASAQITFVSNEPAPSEFARTFKFRNATYVIYSHSFLHLGQNVAYEAIRESLMAGEYQSAGESLEQQVVIDPCTPKGFSHSAGPWKPSPSSLSGKDGYTSNILSMGNFTECRSAALMLLHKGKEKCSYQHCSIGSSFIPKLEGKFLATENFFYTSKFFGLGRRALLSDLVLAGQEFCGEEWLKLKRKHQSLSLDDEDLMHYCFSSAYIVALLHDGFGIALDDERIEYANQVVNIPLDWALGAFILHSTTNLEKLDPGWISTIIGDDSPTLLSLIGIVILLLFVAWTISKWRKPQLKTIYDLEKGRYMVTRIGRTS